MENKEIEDEEMLVNETSEECDLDLEAKARGDEYQRATRVAMSLASIILFIIPCKSP